MSTNQNRLRCQQQWEGSEDDDEGCELEHECVKALGHSGPHECKCGDQVDDDDC